MLRRHYAEDSLVFRVGMRIRKLRWERRLTLRDFGKIAGVHPFHVMAIELGQSAATTKTLQAIAKGLAVAPLDLLNHDIENDDMAYIVERMRQDPEAQRMLIAKLEKNNPHRPNIGRGVTVPQGAAEVTSPKKKMQWISRPCARISTEVCRRRALSHSSIVRDLELPTISWRA